MKTGARVIERPQPYNLRALREDDLAMVLDWRNHDDVRQWMFNRQVIALAQHQAWIEQARHETDRCLLVFELVGIPSGFVNLHPVTPGGIAEWGFYRAPDAPPGSGRLLGKATLDHAFGVAGLHQVRGRVLGENAASIRFHQALGFCFEDTLPAHHHDEDGDHDVLIFGLSASAWRKRTCEATDV